MSGMRAFLLLTVICLFSGCSISPDRSHWVAVAGKIVCAKCTAKKAEKCGPAFVSKDKDGKEVTLLVAGKAAKAIKHRRICKPNSSVEVTITGEIKEGTITAAKLIEKKE